MRTVGLGEVMVAFAGIVGICFYGAVFFAVWKFYQMLEKINGNIAGIRQVLEKDAGEKSIS
jgi:hypothetical protein